jgi:hypothetical protein
MFVRTKTDFNRGERRERREKSWLRRRKSVLCGLGDLCGSDFTAARGRPQNITHAERGFMRGVWLFFLARTGTVISSEAAKAAEAINNAVPASQRQRPRRDFSTLLRSLEMTGFSGLPETSATPVPGGTR